MEPPHKRKRTNTLSTLPLTLPTTQLHNHRSPSPSLRRSHLWFDDGSVVLQAEGTLFKVHRTVLSRHSTVFRDMFSIPQPEVREEEKVDGCPVVVLSDSALDVGELVEVLYDKSYNVRESLPYPTLAAMLRLGRKYDIEHLVAEALVRLTSEFPTTLAEWEKLDEEFTHIRYQKGILFDLVNLAREMGVMSVLPAACYLCIQDLIRDDGTIATLPQHLQNTLILAREQILHAQSTTTLSWVDATPSTCSKCLNPPACASARFLITRKIWKPFPDCSRGLERWSDVPSAGLCGSCVNVAREVHELGRRRMWDLLPGFFGFGGWESLGNCED